MINIANNIIKSIFKKRWTLHHPSILDDEKVGRTVVKKMISTTDDFVIKYRNKYYKFKQR